ncbi:MAG TPA: hypothetical protein VLM11_18095 [Streptosporangiaceae bacterium]|nr:hypothetical protein [Streptosporangiaceae bacterium]
MPDWTTISSLTTGAGTLVLATATFAAVRSANRAARVAEEALSVGLRPLLVPSRLDDVTQKVFYGDGHVERLEGGRGVAEIDHGNVYLGISVRNAGRGIAVLHGWRFAAGQVTDQSRPRLDSFRPHNRDIFIAPNDIGFWQAAFRDPADSQYDEAAGAVQAKEVLTMDVLYGDHEGGQRAISRFLLRQPEEMRQPDKDPPWLASVVRHWNVDRPDPRPADR